jgi:hypothetical protein
MVRISKFVSVVATFVLATAISIPPAGANPDTFTAAPGIITPSVPSIMVGTLDLSYILPQVPGDGSVRVVLTRTSPASPSVRRIFQMGSSQSVSLNIDPFDSDNNIINMSLGNVLAVNPQSDAMQVGVYTITVEYQNAEGSAAATASIAGITLTVRCDVGTYSTDGNVPVGSSCTQAPLGTYVSTTGKTSATPCSAGYFAISLASTSCIPSPAGKFSAAGNSGVAPSDCGVGTYQPSQGQSECLLGRTGHYVSDIGQTTDLACPVGTYRLEQGQASCLDAPAGTYVSVTGAQASNNCLAGTFSASTRSTSCVVAQANFYVDTIAATAATACPATYTSPAGSDSATDCIAPVVSQTPSVVAAPTAKALPSLGVGKKMKIKTLATEIEMSIPAKSKLSAKVAKSSKKFCKVSGTSIKALKTGSCVVTVKVKPKKGSATTKATTITIR